MWQITAEQKVEKQLALVLRCVLKAKGEEMSSDTALSALWGASLKRSIYIGNYYIPTSQWTCC